MPNKLIKNYALKADKSISKVEKLWDEAKKSADKTFDGMKGPKYWAYVNTIVRKRLQLSEKFTFKEFVDLTQLETVPQQHQEEPQIDISIESFTRFIACLFAARDKAHTLHLATKLFSKHVALNELYDLLLDFADRMTETYQGKYGILSINIPAAGMFNQHDEVSFAVALTDWLNGPARSLIGTDDFIINIFEELLGEVYRIKYKLENLA